MKYTLSINQKAIIDNKLDLTLVEAVLLDVIVYMTLSWDEIVKIEFGGRVFFWLDYARMQAQAPMLGLKKDTIYRHIKSLSEKGFLMPHPDTQKTLQRPFFAILPRTSLAFGKKSEGSEKNPKGVGEISEGGSEKNPNYNTIIDNSNNYDSVNDKSLTQTREENLGAEFFEFCRANGLTRLASQTLFLEKEKSCAKKEKYGAAGYLATLQKIEAYLAEKPRYLADKKDFSKIFDNFATDPAIISVFDAFKAAFLARYSGIAPKCTKSDERAAKTILEGLREVKKMQADEVVPQTVIAEFFAATFTLQSFAAPTVAKLAFIAKDFAQIIAAFRSGGGTHRKTAAQLEREDSERRNQQAVQKLYNKAEYDSHMRMIQIVMQRDGGDFSGRAAWLLDTQAYRDYTNPANDNDERF